MHRRPLDAQLKSAYLAAPKPVQDALNDGVATDFVLGLQDTYPIHIDTLGSMTVLVRDLLLGFCTPADFHAEMTLLVGDQNARSIISEFNANVLMKLRDKEKEDQEHPPQQQTPHSEVESLRPPVAPPVSMPVGERAVGPTPAPTYTAPAAPAVPVPPSAPVTPPPAPVPPAPIATPIEPPPAAPMPAMPPVAPEYHPKMRTMATDIEAVREHRMPEPIAVAHTTPLAMPPPQVVTPPPMPPVPPPQIAPVRPMPPPPANLPGAPSVKSYTIDPYREPVE